MTFGSNFGRVLSPTFAPYSQEVVVPSGDDFPTVEGVTRQVIDTNSNPLIINMPATVNSGDLLLMVLAVDGTNTTASAPTGWTEIASERQGALAIVFAKVSVGTEGGSTVSVGISGSERASSHTYRIKTNTWGGTLASVEVASVVVMAGGTFDPPSLRVSWGAKNTLWIAAAAGDTVWGLVSAPTGFTDALLDTSSDTTTITARREYAATDTLNPDSFDISGANRRGGVFTIAIKPA